MRKAQIINHITSYHVIDILDYTCCNFSIVRIRALCSAPIGVCGQTRKNHRARSFGEINFYSEPAAS